MASRDEILQFADDLLGIAHFNDFCPNGLQVIGADEVDCVASAVSCSVEVFERAAKAGAQLLICHHGLYWRDTPQVIGPRMHARLTALFDNDITLAGYHLPLDAHPEIGNNHLIAQALGLSVEETPFAVMGGASIGCIGAYDQPVSFSEFADRLSTVVEQAPLHLGATPDRIARVAICSGGAAKSIGEAIDLGVDAFITGEPSEPALAGAREGGVAFFAAGHYATETFGIRALGERIAKEFGVRHEFILAPNPV